MKTLKFVLRKVFKFIFLFWVVISSLLGSYIIADKFFGRTVVAWTLIRDFSIASLEVPVEMDYSGYKSGRLEVPGLDSAHVRHRLSAEICVSGGACTSFVHYFLPYRHVEGTAALRGVF